MSLEGEGYIQLLSCRAPQVLEGSHRWARDLEVAAAVRQVQVHVCVCVCACIYIFIYICVCVYIDMYR